MRESKLAVLLKWLSRQVGLNQLQWLNQVLRSHYPVLKIPARTIKQLEIKGITPLLLAKHPNTIKIMQIQSSSNRKILAKMLVINSECRDKDLLLVVIRRLLVVKLVVLWMIMMIPSRNH